MDLWTPDPTGAPALFKVKLVDLGADGLYGGGDDVEHELVFDQTVLKTGVWFSIDVALSDFTNLVTKGSIGQMILTSDPNTVFIDNIYFYDSGIPTIPVTPAPTPTYAAADVISLFSEIYTDISVDTWSTPWDSANVESFMVGSDSSWKYTNLLFAGIETTTQTVDASGMTHFRMDVWTPDATASPSVFKIKLVDFGPNGIGENTGGDDAEHEITLDHTVMQSNTWVTLDIPLTSFIGLTTRGHIGQYIISGTPNTIYIDNVMFHK